VMTNINKTLRKMAAGAVPPKRRRRPMACPVCGYRNTYCTRAGEEKRWTHTCRDCGHSWLHKGPKPGV
jgi:transcription elongation factor Elf1